MAEIDAAVRRRMAMPQNRGRTRKAVLDDPATQIEFGQILANHRIDRIVTSAAGGAGVKLSGKLEDQGFKKE